MAAENYFWDSCIFSAYLRDEREAYDIPSIEAFLDDARDGKNNHLLFYDLIG